MGISFRLPVGEERECAAQKAQSCTNISQSTRQKKGAFILPTNLSHFSSPFTKTVPAVRTVAKVREIIVHEAHTIFGRPQEHFSEGIRSIQMRQRAFWAYIYTGEGEPYTGASN